MLSFLTCAHIKDSEKEQTFIKNFSCELENLLGEKIDLFIPENYIEEIKYLSENEVDIYFTDPFTAYQKFKEGFIPFKKKDETEEFFVLAGISDFDKDKVLTISTPYLKGYFILSMLLEELDLLKEHIIYTNSHEEAIEKVKENEADFALLYGSAVSKLINKDNQFKIIKKIKSPLNHYLMVKKELYIQYKARLKNLKYFQEVKPEEFLNELHVSLNPENISNVRQFYDIAKLVYENKYIGIMIYRDKILHINKLVEDITGFSLKELKELEIYQIIDDTENVKEKIKENIQRRVNGEFFSCVYPVVKLNTKNKSIRYVRAIDRTILYKNKYCGLFIFQDISKEIRYQKLYKVLRNINKVITTALTEEELYEAICDSLIKKLDIKSAFITDIDRKNNQLKIKYGCKESTEYLKDITSINERLSQKAYKEGKIIIVPYIEKSNTESIKSCAAIPLFKKGKIVSILNIYSNFPYFFDEETKNLLEEIQYDISFALGRIDAIRDSIILKQSIENSTEWLLMTDYTGKILYVNDFVLKLTGYKKEEILGETPRIFKSGYQSKQFYRELWDTILSGKEFNGIIVNRKKNGELFYLDMKIVPVELPGGIKRFVSIGRDITKEKLLSEENEMLRYYDILTGLYNYNGFVAQVEEYISNNPNKPAILFLLDIADFSYINKTYGMIFGDKILKKVADLLKGYIGEKCIIGKIGGDEFAIFCTEIKDKNDIFELTESIKNLFQTKNIKAGDISIKIQFHGGASVYPDDGKNFYTLHESASVALKEAKEEKKNQIKIFNLELGRKAKRYIKFEEIIEEAIERNLFVFHYQPYFDIKSNKIGGFEALVRIRYKNKLYYPVDFISILENSPHLEKFEKWAVKEAVSKIKKWRKPVHINLSDRSFRRSNFIKIIEKYTKELEQPLILEIIERIYIKDIKKSRETIEKLRKCQNINIAIDDFGTGHSTLAYLKDFDVDMLKIDMSFIKEITVNRKTKALVEGIVHLARSLGLKTVAEGVEITEQLHILEDIGVDYVQGFLLSKPLPEEEIDKKFFDKIG
ncbi:PAS domain S-box-containing protein/diguanylate cyclase (GGDEF) domain-containing protein [Persephonella hydrogeniphila]|uniref:PAS domain S-box-containing protein/diguanylate cyclase (GGDEF) domain-containing protein n=1 Tax=Persephonella hydrogeniphila TaxID=198703 RepID=A0A285N2N6_9AQUI|nr:EAL domain-containing protein [Persephonella hydrogeniphila]SNZ03734.1 PAS domain S-box-containing protein/diguanylate cyclase (GGDEF) domain-containing protein [Persephonella hydrogeniphila]